MIMLAIVATICAVMWTMLIGAAKFDDGLGNGFVGSMSLATAWLIVAALWLSWAFS